MITVGWIDAGTTTGRFTESVTQLVAYETVKERLTSVIRVQSGPLLEEGRNRLVARFLESGAEWLLMVDTDMTFSYDSAERLLVTAEGTGQKMVGGLCYGLDADIGQFPTVYKNVDGLPVAVKDHPSGVIEVDATGAAFTLTHRDLFTEFERTGPHRWFHRRHIEPTDNHPGGVLGEDLSWCWWLRDCGVTILVDTSVTVGHMKQTEINAETMAHATS